MQKWVAFDISNGTSHKDASCGLLLWSYGALLCVQCGWGLESHEYLQGGGGVVEKNGGMGGRQKVAYTPSTRPYTCEYMSMYSEVYGKNTFPILPVY